MKASPLAGKRIGISISESPDMAALGLGPEHLEDAMSEIARHLLACGAKLVYGGDLRKDGFTELLFEIVERYRSQITHDGPLVENFLAWPVHVLLPTSHLQALTKSFADIADLVLLSGDGKRLAKRPRRSTMNQPLTDQDWSEGLTAMRRTMAAHIHARIVLGGRTAGYKGKMPGIAEEASLQLERRAPLYVLGGFGGCGAAIADAMGLTDRKREFGKAPAIPGIADFINYGAPHLNNGLSLDENRILATTTHIDQATALILRGLMKSNFISGPQ